MRLIDANAYAAEMKTRQDACKEILYAAEKDGNDEVYDRMNCAFGVFVEAKLTLDAMPTIDAVPVVRCKECQYYYDDGVDKYCEFTEWHWYHEPDYYCADGERRSDD